MKDLRYLNENRKMLDEFKDFDYDEKCEGMFDIFINGKPYFVVATIGEGWQHVSGSGHRGVMPTWDVMETIKNKFFRDDEFVVEFHPKKEDYINNKENCLHIWSPTNHTIPYPDLVKIKKNKPKLIEKRAINYKGNPYCYEHYVSEDFEYMVIINAFNKRPSWEVACLLKQEVFGDSVAVSYHPIKGDSLYKQNKNHLDQLIIWKTTKELIQTPDSKLVGVKGLTEKDLGKMSAEELLEFIK